MNNNNDIHAKATVRPTDTDRRDSGPGRFDRDMPEWVSAIGTVRSWLRAELFGARLECAIADKTWVNSGRVDGVALEECKAQLRRIRRLERNLAEFSK